MLVQDNSPQKHINKIVKILKKLIVALMRPGLEYTAATFKTETYKRLTDRIQRVTPDSFTGAVMSKLLFVMPLAVSIDLKI